MVTKSEEWWVDAEPSEIEELKATLTEKEQRIKELEVLNQDYVTANIGHVKHIAELEASQPKWISVKDNPHHPINQDFLIAWERDNKFKDMAIRHSVMLTDDFTHWMPLPQPRKARTK